MTGTNRESLGFGRNPASRDAALPEPA